MPLLVRCPTCMGTGEIALRADAEAAVAMDALREQQRGAVSPEAHGRAVNALFAFAQERWGWGSDEHADVADAVEVVLEAIASGGQ